MATRAEQREVTGSANGNGRAAGGVTSLVPERSHPNGPVTRARLRRTFGGITCAWLLGALPLLLDASPGLKAFGIGLFLPGGGFVYTSDPLFAALSLALFLLSVFGMWLLGPVLIPPAVWIGAAALASARTGSGTWDAAEVVVPVAVGVVLLTWFAAQQIVFRRRRQRGRQLNEHLSKVSFPISSAPASPPVTESTPDDLASLRYALDLGLQPLEDWDGFKTYDQFRESALRYQLQFLQYAVAMSQYTRTPAFTGYLAEAQRNAIEKMLDPRVWSYWRWENLWGNLRWDPDPVRRDNVMLSGYWAVMVGLYEAMTGDRRYHEPGSLTFRNGADEVYPYDFPALARLMRENMLGSPFCMFPCEPSWIYPFCNSYALNTVVLHDRLTGAGAAADVVEGFRRGFEQEFVTPDGRIVGIHNGRFGFHIPSTVTVSDAVLSFWLNPALPDISQRLWWVMRQTTVRPPGSRELFPAQRQWDYIDPGNYRLGKDTFSKGAVLLAAREVGDDEVADEVAAAIDAQEPVEERDGVRRHPGASVYGNVQHILARFTRHNAMREMVAFDLPEAWRRGPLLAEAAYPDVLVAKAVSDGSALDLVLRPGRGPTRTRLALDRLEPGGSYEVSGGLQDRIVADEHGRALLDVELSDRVEVRVAPGESP